MDLYSQSLHYGYSVFEGIRSYRTAAGATRIFKAEAHFERLRRSARLLNMPYDWTTASLTEATYALLEQNGLQDAYIRPVVYAPANMTFALNTESFIVIEAWAMQPFLGEKLLRVMTSSFQRPNPKAFHIEAKAAGHYVNSILASQEAKGKGFDEALLLDMNGWVAEGPGANLFYEREGKLFTPAPGNILPGITRATVLDLCAELGMPVEQKNISPGELKQADAAFYCGTAAELVGFESLDDYRFPLEWNNSLSRKLQVAYKYCVTETGPHQPAASIAMAENEQEG